MAEEVFAALDAAGVVHSTRDHVACCTVEEEAAVTHAFPGAHTKSFFLKDKMKRHGLFLLSTAHDASVNLTAVGNALGLGSKVNLRFAADELLEARLAVKHGAVSPLALVNDAGTAAAAKAGAVEDGPVRLVLDAALLRGASEDGGYALVNYHPLVNTRTTAFSPAGLLAFCREIGHEPIVLDFAGGGAKLAPRAPGTKPRAAVPRVAPAAVPKAVPAVAPKAAQVQKEKVAAKPAVKATARKAAASTPPPAGPFGAFWGSGAAGASASEVRKLRAAAAQQQATQAGLRKTRGWFAA